MRDKNGDPHFTITDEAVAAGAVGAGLCAICGGQLGSHKWFVGGPESAFHPKGRYFDGPMHHDCGTFALKTCPFLALAGSYARRIDAKTVKAGSLPDHDLVQDSTSKPGQPAVFVFGDTGRYSVDPRTGDINPERPWRQVQFWQGRRGRSTPARPVD